MREDELKFLANQSLKEDDFSSHTHNQQLMAEESDPFHLKDEFIINERYDIDMVKILPVNLDTLFIYWEITKKLLDRNSLFINNIVAKIFSIRENSESEVFHFSISDEVGGYYAKVLCPMQRLLTKFGYYDANGIFVPILVSNVITTPNDKIEQTNDEIWMSKDKDFKEIIEASTYLSCPLSSREMVINSRVLEELSKRNKLGSLSFARKDA